MKERLMQIKHMLFLIMILLCLIAPACNSGSSGSDSEASGEQAETISLLLPSHIEYGDYEGNEFTAGESVDISVEFDDDTVEINLSMYEESDPGKRSSVMTKTIVTDYSGNVQSTHTVINQAPFDDISITDMYDHVTDDRGNTIAQVYRTDSTGTDEIVETKVTQYYSDGSTYRVTTFKGDIDDDWDTSDAWTEMVTYRSYDEDGNVLEKVIASPVSVATHYYTYEDDNTVIDEVYTGEDETPEVMYKLIYGDKGLLQSSYMMKCSYAWDSANNEWSDDCVCDSWYYDYEETGGVKTCIRETYNRYSDTETDGSTLIDWQEYQAPANAVFLVNMNLDDLKNLFMLTDEE